MYSRFKRSFSSSLRIRFEASLANEALKLRLRSTAYSAKWSSCNLIFRPNSFSGPSTSSACSLLEQSGENPHKIVIMWAYNKLLDARFFSSWFQSSRRAVLPLSKGDTCEKVLHCLSAGHLEFLVLKRWAAPTCLQYVRTSLLIQWLLIREINTEVHELLYNNYWVINAQHTLSNQEQKREGSFSRFFLVSCNCMLC